LTVSIKGWAFILQCPVHTGLVSVGPISAGSDGAGPVAEGQIAAGLAAAYWVAVE